MIFVAVTGPVSHMEMTACSLSQTYSPTKDPYPAEAIISSDQEVLHYPAKPTQLRPH